MENLEKEIKSLVSKITKIPEDKIDLNADIFKDLGVDSLIGTEIFAALDKKFHIEIPEQELDKVKTVNDIITITKQKLYNTK
jgi:acyl carrier protein